MANINQWLHALFTPNSAYGQAAAPAAPVRVAPLTRVGNTYQGQALPAGISSLLASSQDRSAKRVHGDKPPAAGPRLKNLDKRAGDLLANLFAGYPMAAQDYPGIRGAPSDRWADRMLDRTGFFDPYQGGTLNERRQRAIDEWNRRVGMPKQNWGRR